MAELLYLNAQIKCGFLFMSMFIRGYFDDFKQE